MSGPIVRKYGFPNFEKIFGQKPVLHGQDAESASSSSGEESKPNPESSGSEASGSGGGEAGTGKADSTSR